VIIHPVLSDLARFGVRMGLSRMRSFLEFLGDPLSGMKVIHVAGTNGKGSVVRMLGSMLRAGGYRVGEFTSPHLQRINERICINGMEISDDTLNALLHELSEARRRWAAEVTGGEVDGDVALTYFEMITAAALLHMARSKVDVAVLEVGLGGRLDATNLVDPLACAIVSVGLDHTEVLGPDQASIAAEKAGIIKPHRPVVVGPLQLDALRVVRLIARERNAPLLEAGEHYRTLRSDIGRFTWTGDNHTLRDLPLSLAGDHQIDNAGVAVTLLAQVADVLPVSEQAIRIGLSTAAHPGRLEWIRDDVLLDCAHNSEGAASLSDYLRTLPRDRPRTLLLGASADKDVRSMVIQLAPHFDRVLTTRCRHPRAAEAGEIARRLINVGMPVLPAGSIEQAIILARDGSLVVATGSIFLAGAVRDLLGARPESQ
jgi:dihydrofolate synthase/folylpolyglutamate synthase